MEKLKFKILTEDVEVGESINEAQKNIAEGIVNIISENEQASTIGLQGPWGSGKSTIIKQVQEKLDDPNKYIYFYFDAWAHEGDFLRKIFLRNLVEEISNKSAENTEKLSQIRNELEGFTSISFFGIILGFTILFVPFGTEILSSVKFSELDVTINLSLLGITIALILSFFKPNKWIDIVASILISAILNTLTLKSIFALEINCQFILGSFFTLLPILAIIAKILWPKLFLGKYINLFKEFKLISNVYKNDSNDQSSIDFEQYFNEILKLFSQKKFIIVIDNLDRIDHDDAKKIWSTLQIFLQHRNPVSNSEAAKLYKNLWIIIPYDHSSLVKIWDLIEPKAETLENIDSKQLTEEINQIDKLNESFLDKCFQVKLDVPPYTVNNWVTLYWFFIENAISIKQDDLPNEHKIFFERMLNVFSDSNVTPTPRILKNYLNQVLIYNNMIYKYNIPIETLAFYIISRYIKKESINHIKEILMNGLIPDNIYQVDAKAKDNLACILYNISPGKAIELFLEENLVDAFKNKDKLIKLKEEFDYAFWRTIERHKKKYFNEKHLIIVYQVFWNDSKFITKHKSNFQNSLINKFTVSKYQNPERDILSFNLDVQYLDTLIYLCEESEDYNLAFIFINYLLIKTPHFKGEVNDGVNFNMIYLNSIHLQSKIPYLKRKYYSINNINLLLMYIRSWDVKHPKLFNVELKEILDWENSAFLNDLNQNYSELTNLIRYCESYKNYVFTEIVNNENLYFTHLSLIIILYKEGTFREPIKMILNSENYKNEIIKDLINPDSLSYHNLENQLNLIKSTDIKIIHIDDEIKSLLLKSEFKETEFGKDYFKLFDM